MLFFIKRSLKYFYDYQNKIMDRTQMTQIKRIRRLPNTVNADFFLQ